MKSSFVQCFSNVFSYLDDAHISQLESLNFDLDICVAEILDDNFSVTENTVRAQESITEACLKILGELSQAGTAYTSRLVSKRPDLKLLANLSRILLDSKQDIKKQVFFLLWNFSSNTIEDSRTIAESGFIGLSITFIQSGSPTMKFEALRFLCNWVVFCHDKYPMGPFLVRCVCQEHEIQQIFLDVLRCRDYDQHANSKKILCMAVLERLFSLECVL